MLEGKLDRLERKQNTLGFLSDSMTAEGGRGCCGKGAGGVPLGTSQLVLTYALCYCYLYQALVYR